jgi:hypothetical protein
MDEYWDQCSRGANLFDPAANASLISIFAIFDGFTIISVSAFCFDQIGSERFVERMLKGVSVDHG